tara:strand:+ start:95 stop:433 length:339 start_codon:yes stop_codon:yes gene_type:complete
MFKIGDAKTRQGNGAYIFEITEDKIYGRYMIGESWVPGVWHTGGLYVGAGFPSLKDLVPNDGPPPATKLLAYVSSSGMVKYAVEGSPEAMYFDKDAMAMQRAPRFDIAERDV